MIVRGFKSVIWVATVGGAALACYMVSLRVATERADLARVERQIISAKRDIRSLQTELGTRGRLSQLEQWNADVLALSAPSTAQFLQDEVKLARFERTEPSLDERSAEVRLAALSTGDEAPAPAPAAPRMVHALAPAAVPAAPSVRQASYTPDTTKPQPVSVAAMPSRPKAAAAAPTAISRADDVKAAPGPAVRAAPETVARAQLKPVAPVKPEVRAAGKAPAAAKADARPAARLPAVAKADAGASAKAPSAKGRPSRIDGKLAAEIKAGSHGGQGSGGN